MAFVLSKIIDHRYLDFSKIEPPYPEDIPSLTKQIFSCVIPYILFIYVIGPKFMANRKPYDLKPLMLTYNALQIIVNAWFFYKTCEFIIETKPFSFIWLQCLPSSEHQYQLTKYYLWIKLLDLIETCIFVLRKKYNQVSFLHVYHHLIIISGVYLVLIVEPGGIGSFLGMANAFVHTLMYAYYFMTIYRPELRSWISLKKRMTQIQMYQFAYLIIHFGGSFLFNTCPYNKFLSFYGCSQNIYMLFLFSDFYIKAYKSNPFKF